MSETRRSLLEAAAPNVNAVVSASAGTGKTWLLVARLLRLLLAGESPASILAITFTQKAAAEIRERLTASVRAWTQADDATLESELRRIGAPPGQARHARELYETLIYAENDVHILTFHAFCREILERFPLEARVPAGFEICSEEWTLHDAALNNLYTEAAGDERTAQALNVLFKACNGLANTNQALRNFLAHRNDWLAYTEDAEDPAQAAAAQLGATLGIKPEDVERGVALDERTRELLQQHTQLLSRHATARNRKYIAAINDFLAADAELNLETLPPLMNCFIKNDGDPRKHEFETSAFTTELGGDLTVFSTNFVTLVDTFTQINEILKRRRAFQCNRAWYTAGQRLSEIYRELKLTRRELDFNDLEWLACRLLNHTKDAQWVQYRLNERIRHVLVDEFQDTNPQQWQLLKPLLDEMASQEGGGSAFIVGDVKQSIYGFRRASPELQDEAAQWLAQNMDGKTYTIDVSRRSSPAVIEFVNRVFDRGDGHTTRLPDFRRHDTALGTPGSVVFLPFAEKGARRREHPAWRAILRDPPVVGDDPPAREEGERIATCITRMMNDRVAVRDLDGNARPLRYGDVTILLRRRTRLDHYEQALIKAGIPHNSGRAEKTFGSMEVADVLALLEFLLDHERNLSLAQVLRSPIFAVDDEQLIALAQVRGGGWFTRLARLRDDEVLNHAHALLGDWIDAARNLPPHDLLDRVYHDGDVIRRYRLAAPDGEEDLSERNLLELLDYSLEFESGRYPDLAHFARRLKQRIAHAENAQATGSDDPDDPDRVRILTVHQAKGLEAPVIILADCGRQRKRAETHNVLADWPARGERPAHFLLIPKDEHRDRFTEDCLRKLKARDRAEAENLLYVAVTRARQYLLVSGSGVSGGADNGDKPGDGVDDSDWYARLHACAPETAPGSAREPATAPTTASTPQWECLPPSADDTGKESAPPPERTPERARVPLPDPPPLEVHPHSLVGTLPATAKSGTDKNGTLRGEVVHYALKLLSENTGEDVLQNALLAAFPQAGEKLREWVGHARALIADENLEALFDDSRYEQVLNEVPIAFMHDGEQYFGVIDRVCVGRDAIWLVDYKTHASSDRHAEQIKSHYTEQMRAYYLGATKLWPGRTVRASLLLTENRQLCDYRFAG